MSPCRCGRKDGRRSAAAFEALFVDHEAELYRYLARRVDASSAERAVASVFATAWQQFPRRRSRPTPRVWLFGLAVAEMHRCRADEQAFLERLVDEPDAQGTGGGSGVARALAALPGVDRDLLTLHVWAGLPKEVAASVVGLSRRSGVDRIERAVDFVRRRSADA